MQYLFLAHTQLQQLLDLLQQAGYRIVGPQVRAGAIVYDTLKSAADLPWGVRDQQEPGEYKLINIPQHEAFAFSNGAEAIKPQLFKPYETLWRVSRDAAGKLSFVPEQVVEQPVAILGARACDIAAMTIQDKVFLQAAATDKHYAQRRQQLFVVGVNCGYSSNNCFCVSAGCGPKVITNYDIVMTELAKGFVINSDSDKGEAILQQLNLKPATKTQLQQAEQRSLDAAAMQTKQIPLNNSKLLRDILFNNLDHPRWDDVAQRCLSCGNCTQSCPTCFCHSETEQPSIDGASSAHEREWDSCFTAGHSYMGHEVLRDDTRKRYRQWLTHKVGSWHEQFDTSGCVGCGRCVTWCPVGIDITAELAAITGESNVK